MTNNGRRSFVYEIARETVTFGVTLFAMLDTNPATRLFSLLLSLSLGKYIEPRGIIRCRCCGCRCDGRNVKKEKREKERVPSVLLANLHTRGRREYRGYSLFNALTRFTYLAAFSFSSVIARHLGKVSSVWDVRRGVKLQTDLIEVGVTRVIFDDAK